MKRDLHVDRYLRVLLIAYTFIMLYLLFFSYGFRFGSGGVARDGMRSVNFTPLKSIADYLNGVYHVSKGAIVYNLLGNIAVFIPFGIFLYLYKLRNIFLVSFLAAFCSCSVELLQYAFKIGVTDIDDVILNTLGAFIGAVICKLAFKMMKSEKKVRIFVLICGVTIFISVAAMYMLRF